MKKYLIPLSLVVIFACSQNKFPKMNAEYPKTKKVDTVDTYFGTKVPDPFRWLEDDKSAETAEWVKAQNKITFDFLESIPFRSKIKERLTKIWNYEKIGVPAKEGNNYFYFKNDGLQNQSVMYITDDIAKVGKVFIDPNTFSKEGNIALGSYSFSKDGKYIAYQLSTGGSDWNEIFIKNVETGEMLKDKLEWVKFSGISWTKEGFYYSCYDKPTGSALSKKNEFHKVKFHKLGTAQSADKLVFENSKFPLRNYGAWITDDEKYLLLTETESTSGNSLLLKDLSKPNSTFITIAEGFEFDYNALDIINGKLYMVTNEKASRYKLVAIDLQNPKKENWKEIIPETADVLEWCQLGGKNIIAQYMKDVHSELVVFDYQGTKINSIQLPTVGTIQSFSCKKDNNTAYYAFTSYTTPSEIYKYDIAENKSEIHFKPKVDFNSSEFEVKQIFYTSKDGTKVPMDLVYKKGIELNGNNPTLIYGYGGFNISYKPNFSVSRMIWLENGGIYVNAHIRGGGEYGEDWHQAGTKLKKQNVFDDFIAAAEYLINEKYTSPSKLAIQGGSNGGLLVGAVLNQRPDLYRVAFPAVGVMDMLRYHKFTIGWAWATDYGTSDDSIHFPNLIKYSPLHSIKENTEYPAVLITTADHDDRVVPAHSFKYAATLQEKQKGNSPILIRIETMAGHGAGKSTTKTIEEASDIWSFAFFNMGVTPKY